MPSENGWEPARASASQCEWVKVPGANVTLQLLKGQPLAILRAFAADFNAYVEPLRDADSAGYTPTNSVPTSNHLNGTAVDLNWQSHPFHVKGTFNAAQMKTIRELLAFYENTVFWGGDWKSPIDEMHWNMSYNTYGNPKVQDFINRKIRPDGFSTYKRGAAPPAPSGLTAERLSQAMGGSVPLERYRALLPGVRAALAQSGCAGNLNRLAMWLAQIGHESGGLKYMEEIASGAAYEGRTDLGNTQPGDGVRFKGRGPIQVTGRHNYTKLSQWAFGQNLVPTPTFFIDQPAQLASDQYGFLGAVWYWTVARPQINSLCDAGDLEGVTRAINGGLNGLTDRRTRWDRCRAMGLAALNIDGQAPPPPPPLEEGFLMALSDAEQRALFNAIMNQRPSRSPLRHLGETNVGDTPDQVWDIDSSVHLLVVDMLARHGSPEELALLQEIAAADPQQFPDRQKDRLLAQAILADLGNPAPATPAPVPAPQPVSPPAPVVVYQPPPEPRPAINGSEASQTTGEIIGELYEALDKLRLADALPIEARAPLAALVQILQLKNGSQI